MVGGAEKQNKTPQISLTLIIESKIFCISLIRCLDLQYHADRLQTGSYIAPAPDAFVVILAAAEHTNDVQLTCRFTRAFANGRPDIL